MKERLMKLLYETMCEQYDKRCQITAQDTADHLLSNGVVVLPCAVGDTVWVCNYYNGNVYENRVDGIYITGASGWKNTVRLEYKNIHGEVQYRKFAWKQIGKTVFLTKEEAEKALKEK